jgi:dTDP-4-amino-4,6-dideoxygalactose transaminase
MTSPAVSPTVSPKVPQKFPFLDLRMQFEGIREEVMDAVRRTMESQRFILGPEVEALEAEIAAYVGCKYAIACASGSDALLLALMALDVGPGDEVITTPFTFFATGGAIARLGAKPVFADIDPDTYNLDPDLVAKVITRKTKAILPVHLFGLPAEMDHILELARRHNLAVIEDAAQSLGAQYHGTMSGNIGTVGCFSFFPSKNLGGAGDGGMITTNDPALGDKLRVLRVHGSRRKYDSEMIGINSRLDALQAAILRVKLRHLEKWTERRRQNAAAYNSLLRKSGLEAHVVAPFEPPAMRHVYNQYVVRLWARDALRQHLSASGIPTEVYYPKPLHLQPAFAYLGSGLNAFPHAEIASQQVLALPVYPEMTTAQQQAVIDAISAFWEQQ